VNQALWFASRATGLVSLLLLTGTVVLGIATTGRAAGSRWPRFAVADLHRNLSLLAVVFLGVHIATAVIDPYAGIRWADALLPFVSVYQPFWLGLGAVALDLLIAVLVTSLVRSRLPRRVWRAVHWAGYALFPVAVAHGLGTGGLDSRQLWVLGCVGFCLLTVTAGIWWRQGSRHRDTAARRVARLDRLTTR
jgi:predicted ferric reductase